MMASKYILAIDQSTSSTKAILFSLRGELVARCNVDHKQYYPQQGWVEHDAAEIYRNTLKAIQGVLQKGEAEQNEVAALSISNQRETTVLWDGETSKPVARAVVWQCNRGSAICNELKKNGYAESIRSKTGLVISPFFSASKAAWVLGNVPEARQVYEAGKLMFGTIDSWLVWNLTGGRVHITDYSNASRTMMFNLHTLKWDTELLELYGLSKLKLPEVQYSDEVVGRTAKSQGFEKDLPIAGVMGDSHAALFGQSCFQAGMAKATYGTGSSIMMNTGRQPIAVGKGLVTSIAWGMKAGVEYVIEGNINYSGDTIKWMVEDLQLIPDSKSAGKLAAGVESNGGVYLVPAFGGLGAPYWDNEARATLTGMTRSTKREHVVRAAEESIAYQIKDVLDAMMEESGIRLAELRVDGGATRDAFLMQFQADMLDVPVVRTRLEELSAQGTATMAGLAVGIYSNKEEIEALRVTDVTFTSQMDAEQRQVLYAGWKEAVRRTLTVGY